MSNQIYVLNGPNLNLLGTREPGIYGDATLASVETACRTRAGELGFEIEFFQSNSEGALVDKIHEAGEAKASGLIINAGAYSHTSVALLDALRATGLPCVEVHISNIFTREKFRHHTYISLAAIGVICGLGPKGYTLAIEGLKDHLDRVG
ncbi:MAG: type II 3-dehydroquinate dehydratase [Methyloligellaceae bacterium]